MECCSVFFVCLGGMFWHMDWIMFEIDCIVKKEKNLVERSLAWIVSHQRFSTPFADCFCQKLSYVCWCQRRLQLNKQAQTITMELKVWVEGIQRIVCGVSETTTCQVSISGVSIKLLSQTICFLVRMLCLHWPMPLVKLDDSLSLSDGEIMNGIWHRMKIPWKFWWNGVNIRMTFNSFSKNRINQKSMVRRKQRQQRSKPLWNHRH